MALVMAVTATLLYNIASEQVELHGPYIRRLHIGVEDVHHFKQFKLFKMGRYLNLHE